MTAEFVLDTQRECGFIESYPYEKNPNPINALGDGLVELVRTSWSR